MTQHTKWAYYNENDPKAAAWLRELMRGGHIAEGEVDERSITTISADEIRGFRQVHCFAGIAGWSRALRLAGWSDDEPVWTCSCPCQPFSAAGQGRGTDDERHLWPVFFRLVEACGPGTIFGEQVASAAVLGSSAKPSKRRPALPPESVWLDGVFADLESAHYACGASDLPAACVGAPHIRQRAFWVAYAENSNRRSKLQPGESATDRRRGFTGDRTTGGLAKPNGREPGNRDIQRSGEHGQQPKNGCLGRMAKSNNSERRTDVAKGNNGNGSQAGWIEGHGESRECCEIGRVGDSARGGCGEQRDATFEGRGGHALGASWAGFDPWREYRIIMCRDGKARRIPGIPEPSFQSLADGFSDDVDAGWRQSDGSIFPLAKGVQGRIGILRGAGNSITPEVAAEFIQACEEARQGLHHGRLLTLDDF